METDVKKLLVTVLTVTYKKLDFIYDVIDSVLVQDYPQIEYIISDDGTEEFPKDEIIDYINQNKKSNIVSFSVIYNEKNLGTVKNMNNAIKSSNGDIICTLSGDDQFSNHHAISEIVKEMSEKKSELLVTGGVLCDENLLPIGEYPCKSYRKHIYKLDTSYKQLMKHIVGMDFAMAPGSMWSYTRKIYNELDGFDERFDLYEDGPFVAKMTLNDYKIDFNYEINARLIRTGGISSTPNNPRIKKDLKLYHDIYLKNLDLGNNRYEKNRLKYWYNILNCESVMCKIVYCLLHPIYTFEYTKYFLIKNIKK